MRGRAGQRAARMRASAHGQFLNILYLFNIWAGVYVLCVVCCYVKYLTQSLTFFRQSLPFRTNQFSTSPLTFLFRNIPFPTLPFHPHHIPPSTLTHPHTSTHSHPLPPHTTRTQRTAHTQHAQHTTHNPLDTHVQHTPMKNNPYTFPQILI